MPFENVTRPEDGGPYPCPCCGFVTLPERGRYDICPVCFWEDDGQDDHDADTVRGGPNYEVSLTQARGTLLASGHRVSECFRTFGRRSIQSVLADAHRQIWVSPHRRVKKNGRVPHIVDPTPLIGERLKAIDAEFLPRLQAAGQAVNDATTRRERREARRLLASVSQEHQAARRGVNALRGLNWFISPRG